MVTRISSYGVVRREGEVLLCRLSTATATPGRWTLPGGGLEFGEAPEVALYREILEETGLKARNWRLLKVHSDQDNYGGRPFHNLRFLFSVDVVDGALRNEAAGSTDRCGWIREEAVSELPCVSIVRTALALREPVLSGFYELR